MHPKQGQPQGYYQDDRDESGYDASRYYRPGPNYQERVLSSDDRVYRGTDGRYYCKRNDGTTGLVLGAVSGGILGNVIDGGHSRVVFHHQDAHMAIVPSTRSPSRQCDAERPDARRIFDIPWTIGRDPRGRRVVPWRSGRCACVARPPWSRSLLSS